MRQIAVKVEGLSKRYRIGVRDRYPTFKEALMCTASAPLQRFRSWLSGKRKGVDSGWIWALRNIDFSVHEGEVVGIIGRNGAGKSTLLKVLSGITVPTAGYVDIYGRVGSLLEVGTGFHMELTGRENIFMNGALLGMHRFEIKKKFDEIVAFSEVEEFLDTPVKRYSSGMYMRLAFAVAAHLEPDILMVDEVLSVGDVAFQRKCMGKMGNVAREGRTILLVSHNMLTIQSLCTKGILLEKGTVTFEGPADEAVMKYLESIEQFYTGPMDLRTDREGGDIFRFADVRFLDFQTKTPVKALISGQPIIIRMGYICRSSRILTDVGISVTIFTATGTHVLAFENVAVNVPLNIPPGKGYTDCVVPRWPLKAGRYTYDLTAEKNGNDLDWIETAGAFEVETGDYYGSGVIPSADEPGVLVDYSWQREVKS